MQDSPIQADGELPPEPGGSSYLSWSFIAAAALLTGHALVRAFQAHAGGRGRATDYAAYHASAAGPYGPAGLFGFVTLVALCAGWRLLRRRQALWRLVVALTVDVVVWAQVTAAVAVGHNDNPQERMQADLNRVRAPTGASLLVDSYDFQRNATVPSLTRVWAVRGQAVALCRAERLALAAATPDHEVASGTQSDSACVWSVRLGRDRLRETVKPGAYAGGFLSLTYPLVRPVPGEVTITRLLVAS